MHITIEPMHIVKREENQVTSPDIIKRGQRKIADNYTYDEKGLFSRKIFGRVGHCDCGNLQEPGICPFCNTRVIDPNNMPDFFIDLGIKVPKYFSDFTKIKDVKPLLQFEAFLAVHPDGTKEIVMDDDFLDFAPYRECEIHIGLDAAMMKRPGIGDWADRYMTDFVSVPHPMFRPNLRMESGKLHTSSINKSLINLLININRVNDYNIFNFDVEELDTDDEDLKASKAEALDKSTMTYFLLAYYRELYNSYNACMKEIFAQFCGGKKSFVADNMRAHRITNAIKGTAINRYDVDEDIILIGDTFIQTLYPYLYKMFDGDMETINNYLIDTNAVVLMNRPPTICHLSIMAFKPRVASCYKHGTFFDGAVGKNKPSAYDEEEDTIGIRTIGVNPIITDGFNLDFDGDCILVIPIYSEQAKREALTMLPSNNFMNYANGEIRNVIPEDIVFSEQQ